MPLMTPSIEHEQVARTIREYISEQVLYDRPNLELSNDFPLIEQGVIDSLQMMQLITFLQQRLGYVVEPAELRLENFESINAIAALVSRSS